MTLLTSAGLIPASYQALGSVRARESTTFEPIKAYGASPYFRVYVPHFQAYINERIGGVRLFLSLQNVVFSKLLPIAGSAQHRCTSSDEAKKLRVWPHEGAIQE